MRELQDLLADDFRGQKALRLIGQIVRRIQRLAFRQPIDERALEAIDVVAGRRGHRHDLGKGALPAVLLDHR